MLKLNKLELYVKDLLLDELENYYDITQYGCDIAYQLLESYNIDGTITYSTYKAKEWLKEYFDNLDEVVEEYHFQTGELLNPFENVERFMVIIVMEIAQGLLSRTNFINDNWNDEITLDKNTIKTITSELNALQYKYIQKLITAYSVPLNAD